MLLLRLYLKSRDGIFDFQRMQLICVGCCDHRIMYCKDSARQYLQLLTAILLIIQLLADVLWKRTTKLACSPVKARIQLEEGRKTRIFNCNKKQGKREGIETTLSSCVEFELVTYSENSEQRIRRNETGDAEGDTCL